VASSAEARILRHEASLLAYLDEGRRYRVLGCVSIGELGENLLQIDPQKARDLVALDRACRVSRALERSILEGRLKASQAIALIPVADLPDAGEWVKAAERMSVRAIRRAVHERRKDLILESPEGRRIEFLAPVGFGAVHWRAMEMGRRVVGSEAPQYRCIEAALAESGVHSWPEFDLAEDGAGPCLGEMDGARAGEADSAASCAMRRAEEPPSPSPRPADEELVGRGEGGADRGEGKAGSDGESAESACVGEREQAGDDEKQGDQEQQEGESEQGEPGKRPRRRRRRRRPEPSPRRITRAMRERAEKALGDLYQHEADLSGLIERGVPASAQEALDRLLQLERMRRPLRCLLGRLLRAVLDCGAHRRLGYPSLQRFVTSEMRVCERTARNLLDEAEIFRDHPVLEEAYASGRIGSRAVHLVRFAGCGGRIEAHLDRIACLPLAHATREARLLRLLGKADPMLARRFGGPFPHPGLEEALHMSLRARHVSEPVIARELRPRGWLRPRRAARPAGPARTTSRARSGRGSMGTRLWTRRSCGGWRCSCTCY